MPKKRRRSAGTYDPLAGRGQKSRRIEQLQAYRTVQKGFGLGRVIPAKDVQLGDIAVLAKYGNTRVILVEEMGPRSEHDKSPTVSGKLLASGDPFDQVAIRDQFKGTFGGVWSDREFIEYGIRPEGHWADREKIMKLARGD